MSDPPRPPKDRPASGPHRGQVAEHQRPGSLFAEPELAHELDGGLDGEPGGPADDAPSADAGELADHLVPAAWGDAQGEAADAGEALFPLGPERLRSVVESLLFAADKPLTTARIVELLEDAAAAPRDASGPPLYQASQITAALHGLAAELRVGRRGIELHEVAGGWQLRTAPENAPWVQRLLQQKPVRLSRAQIETLAIIAYRQPITRPEIDDIRGVDSGGSLKTLLERGLIRILGKKEEPGRPLLYGTTKDFLEFFNLRDLKDLPTLREYNDLSDEHKAKMRSLGHEPPEPGAAVATEPAGAATEGSLLDGVLADGAGAIDVPPGEPAAPAGGEAPAAAGPAGPPRELIDQQLADDAEQLAKIDEMIRTVSTAFPLLDPTLLGAQPGELGPLASPPGSPSPESARAATAPASEDGARRRGRKPGAAPAPAAPMAAAPEPFSDDDDDELSGDADDDREPEEL
ncbi:MAG: SMC-Scp complex subunit ScpB [Polyangia bacterium]